MIYLEEECPVLRYGRANKHFIFLAGKDCGVSVEGRHAEPLVVLVLAGIPDGNSRENPSEESETLWLREDKGSHLH